jgi:hypothetical protein
VEVEVVGAGVVGGIVDTVVRGRVTGLFVVGVVDADDVFGGDSVTWGRVVVAWVVAVTRPGSAPAGEIAATMSRPTARIIHNPTITRATALATGPVCHEPGSGWTTTAAPRGPITWR